MATSPQALQQLGAGAWRLAHVMLWWAEPQGTPQAGSAAAQARALAARYHCPVVALGPGAEGHAPRTLAALPTPHIPTSQRHNAFALAYVAWATLALKAAAGRAPGSVPGRNRHADHEAWDQALTDCADNIGRLAAAVHPGGSSGPAVAALARHCHNAKRMQVVCDPSSAAAVQAWARQLPPTWPPVAVVPDHGATLAPEATVVLRLRPPQTLADGASQSLGGCLDVSGAAPLQLPELPAVMWPLWAHCALMALSAEG